MLVFFALALVVLLGFCGLAIDVGMLQLKQLQMQNAADSAARAAVYALSGGASAWTAAAQADAAANGFSDSVNGVSVLQPMHLSTGLYAGNPLALLVTITQAANPIFIPGAKTVSAQATALAPAGDCLYLLSQTSNNYSLDISVSTVTANCVAYLGLSYNVDHDSTATGGQVNIYGSGSNSNGILSPQPVLNIPKQADPFANLAPPAVGGCLQTNYTPNASVTLNSGTYCGNTNLGNATYTFNPGIYVFTGQLQIQHNAIATGDGVTLYLSSSGNQVQFSNATVNLSAPTSGPYQGILFYSDRGLNPNQTILQLSNLVGSSTLDGVLYAPGEEVQILDCPAPHTAGTLQGNSYFGIVADRLQVHDSSVQFSSTNAALGANAPASSIVNLVQ